MTWLAKRKEEDQRNNGTGNRREPKRETNSGMEKKSEKNNQAMGLKDLHTAFLYMLQHPTAESFAECERNRKCIDKLAI